MMNLKNINTTLKNFSKQNLTIAICFVGFCGIPTLSVQAAQINLEQEFASENRQDITEIVLQLQQNSLNRDSQSEEKLSRDRNNRNSIKQGIQNQENIAAKDLVRNLQNFGDDGGTSLGTLLPVGAMISLCLYAHTSEDEDDSDSEKSSLLCYMPLLITLADMLRDGDKKQNLIHNDFQRGDKNNDIPPDKKAVPEPLSLAGTAIAGTMGYWMKRKYGEKKLRLKK
ncbi:PEP-CTERM sorting domain-containing protein [Mastigocoleus testarum]|nr:PEP-CTERM sorting domain-containing protein [Mastigocoleus testarum]